MTGLPRPVTLFTFLYETPEHTWWPTVYKVRCTLPVQPQESEVDWHTFLTEEELARRIPEWEWTPDGPGQGPVRRTPRRVLAMILTDRLRSIGAGVRLWFTPARVREEGTTPDYRFSLANERTFLAWLRTGLALVGGGFAVDQFLPRLHDVLRVTFTVVLLVGGALCAVRAVNHWVRCERAMRRGEDLPASRFPAVLAIAVGLLAAAMVVLVVIGWTR